MLENNLRPQPPTKEGIIVADPDGVVIAWRDGLARRFSWEQLRQLSLIDKPREQSLTPESARAQRAA